MDKRLALRAIEKLQKREHLIRVTHYQLVTGRITQEEFKKKEAEIIEEFRLTPEEQRAYEQYVRLQQMKRR